MPLNSNNVLCQMKCFEISKFYTKQRYLDFTAKIDQPHVFFYKIDTKKSLKNLFPSFDQLISCWWYKPNTKIQHWNENFIFSISEITFNSKTFFKTHPNTFHIMGFCLSHSMTLTEAKVLGVKKKSERSSKDQLW